MNLDKKKIGKKLKDRGALLPCHRCGNQSFSILDQYTKIPVQEDIDKIQDTVLGGASVPAVIVACNRCGAITYHAFGALGLLPKDGGTENVEKR